MMGKNIYFLLKNIAECHFFYPIGVLKATKLHSEEATKDCQDKDILK